MAQEPWKYPTEEQLPDIHVEFKTAFSRRRRIIMPYARDERAFVPGQYPVPRVSNIAWGVGKETLQEISAVPDNHELMVKLRQEKVR